MLQQNTFQPWTYNRERSTLFSRLPKETSMFYNLESKFDNVYIHPNEIVSINIEFDENKMDKSEYLSVYQEFY